MKCFFQFMFSKFGLKFRDTGYCLLFFTFFFHFFLFCSTVINLDYKWMLWYVVYMFYSGVSNLDWWRDEYENLWHDIAYAVWLLYGVVWYNLLSVDMEFHVVINCITCSQAGKYVYKLLEGIYWHMMKWDYILCNMHILSCIRQILLPCRAGADRPS